MALNVTASITAALQLAAQLISDAAAAKAKEVAGATLTTEIIDISEAVLADPAVQASFKALISAL